MALRHALKVPQCPGVDHMDYTADGRDALVSCEFGGRMSSSTSTTSASCGRSRSGRARCRRTSSCRRTAGRSTSPTWPRTASGSSTPLVARDQAPARRAAGAHGLYPSRDGRDLYVSNRGEGSISLLSFRTGRPVRQWRLPGGGSPDMGGVSADGRVLWLTGRYDAELYAISTAPGTCCDASRSAAARTAPRCGRSRAATPSATPASCGEGTHAQRMRA